MANTYVVTMVRPPGVSMEDVERVLDSAKDWYRYQPNCWIVVSTSAAKQWNERLKPFVEKGGNLFICAIDPNNRSGWMPKAFWEWISRAADRV